MTASGTLLALMYDQVPQRSTNAGASWTPVTANDSGFTRLAFESVAVSASGSMMAATNKGLFRSTDDGANWSRISAGGALVQTALSAVLYSPSVNALVFAGDRGGNFYCSPDDGQNWSLVATLSAPILGLRNQSGQVWAITDGAGVGRFLNPTTCP